MPCSRNPTNVWMRTRAQAWICKTKDTCQIKTKQFDNLKKGFRTFCAASLNSLPFPLIWYDWVHSNVWNLSFWKANCFVFSETLKPFFDEMYSWSWCVQASIDNVLQNDMDREALFCASFGVCVHATKVLLDWIFVSVGVSFPRKLFHMNWRKTLHETMTIMPFNVELR